MLTGNGTPESQYHGTDSDMHGGPLIPVGTETARWHGVAATRRNRIGDYDKPNEDCALADNARQIYMVLDGVSRTPRPGCPYANPSPAAQAAELFASVTHAELRAGPDGTPPAERLRRAAAAGNAAVADFNRHTFPRIDYLENNPAGCVGVLALIEERHLHYAYLGDSSGRLLFPDGTAGLFTSSQTAPLSRVLPSLGLSGDERTIHIRRDVCNNRHHQYGFGVFNGSPGAMDFLVTGSLPLTGIEVILLATDGLDPLLDTLAPSALLSLTPEELLISCERIEDQHPDLRSDDKTVVVIREATRPGPMGPVGPMRTIPE